MDKVIGAIVVALIITLAILLMLRSWRRRRMRDSGLGGYPVPDDPQPRLIDLEALYVATTPAGSPVERLALPGLAFRAKARLEISHAGMVISATGERPVFVPADRITDVATASWAIDRGVEREGLVVIGWTARREEIPAVAVESYVRAQTADEAARVIRIITELRGAVGGSRSKTEGGA